MKYFVYIRDMRLYAYHGVLPEENVIGNEYIVNAKVGCNRTDTFESDSIDDAMDYSKLADIIKHEMETPSKLLEHVADRIRKAVLSTFADVESVSIDIRKLVPPMGCICDGAGVVLEWEK